MNLKLFKMLFIIIFIASTSTFSYSENLPKYGVFLNISEDNLYKLYNYDIVVIDAQNFSKKAINVLKSKGITVYSYLNIGSIENFRPYYNNFKNIILKNYENWEEEYWIDISNKKWHDFIINTLAKSLIDKGIDGFFIDNTDVYYYNESEQIFDGVSELLKDLKKYNKDVIINGGDFFIDKYYKRYKSVNNILNGINQENVFSSIDFKNNKFISQTMETNSYYKEHLKKYKHLGIKIYITEYTTNKLLIQKIKYYCIKNGYHYYISDSIELDI